MDDLNNHKEKLEANLLTLNKFEGLESDLIQQHGNLRAQFSEYREAIESSNLSEKEKREHFSYHDELIKKLHKLILEAKALARKKTEQMTRDELFKLSQERQKALKPQSAEDKIGDEVTKSLKRMLETMKAEVERSSTNISTARETTKNLQGTTENYEKLSGTLEESRGLIRDLWKKNRNDMIYIMGALGVFIATAMWVILQRTPGVVWLPGKLVLRQLGNLIPNSDRAVKFVERVVEMTESALSDNEDVPEMFVDRIERKDEYGSDDLLKQEQNEIEQPTVILENSEPETFVDENFKRVVTESIQEDHQNTQEQVIIPTPVDNINTAIPIVQERAISPETVSEPIIPESAVKDVDNDTAANTTKNQSSASAATAVIPVEIEKRTDEAETNTVETPVVVQEASVKEITEVNEIPNKSETGQVILESNSQTETQPEIEEIATTIQEIIEPLIIETAQSAINTQVLDAVGDITTTVNEPTVGVTAETNLKNVASSTQIPVKEVASVVPAEPTLNDIMVEIATTVNEIMEPATIVTTEPFTSTKAPEIVSTADSVPTETFLPSAEATETISTHEIIPTATSTTGHKITTESTYYTATESEFEGNQSNYSSDAGLFSTSEEKMEL